MWNALNCVFEQYDEVNGYDKERFLRVCLVSIIQKKREQGYIGQVWCDLLGAWPMM